MFLETLTQDASHAARLFVKNPAFTATVVLSLALGIGANTAIFTLMDAVMWRLLPVKDAEHLLVLERRIETNRGFGFNYSQFKLLRDNSRVVDVAGYATAPVNASVDGGIEPALQGQLVTGGYFSVLGVNAFMGRTIGPEDDRVPNGHPVVMLSYGYWQRRFAREPLVIGRIIRISDLAFAVIGITPPEFFGVEVGVSPDVFLPIMMQPVVMSSFENLLDNPIVNRSWVQTVARLKPGILQAEAEGVLTSSMPPNPAPPGVTPPQQRIVLTTATASSNLGRQFAQPLIVLMAMVGVVLLIACANTANLLLARSASRRAEFAMRLALGASRGRLIRQLLVESIGLAAMGGILGMATAYWATRLLVFYMSSGRTPIQLDLSPNLRIMAFTAAVSLMTGLLFGLAPAIRSTRIDLTPALKMLGRSTGNSFRFGKALAVVQMTLSLLLLVSTGLFVRSLQQLTGISDVPRDSVIIVRVEPKGSDQRNIPGTTARLDQIYRSLLETVRQIPDIRSASLAQAIPSGGTNSGGTMVKYANGQSARVPMLMVYTDYFSTIGIPIVVGREFNDSDMRENARAVCIVRVVRASGFSGGESDRQELFRGPPAAGAGHPAASLQQRY